MTAPTFGDLTTALLLGLAEVTGKPCGDQKAPGGGDDQPAYPYGILRRGIAGDWEGAIGHPGQIVRVPFEYTAVGKRADQARALGKECPPMDLEGPVVNDLRGFILTVSVV